MITTFYEVSVWGQKSFRCQCGKRVRRSKTFAQTINPYNRTAEGAAKTREQIMDELMVERREWLAMRGPCVHPGVLDETGS